jgi:methyl-accepting chemotaxis protein
MKISHKLWLIVALMMVSLTALTVVAHFKAQRVDSLMQEIDTQTEVTLLITSTANEFNNVLLAAMDIIVDKESGKPDDTLVSEAATGAKAIADNIKKMLELDPATATEYNAILAKLHAIHGTMTDESKGLYAAVINHAPPETFAEFDDAIDGTGVEAKEMLSAIRVEKEKALSDLNTSVHADIDQANRFNWIVFVISTILALVTVGTIARSIAKPLDALTHDINDIAAGNTDAHVSTADRHDEIGSIARALESLRIKAEESFRLKHMVDDMPLNVMTADVHNNFNINYMNNTSKKTLRSMLKHLPVTSENLEGQSIDIFHKNPQRIRQLLSVPSNLPHNARIQVGPETLDLKVSAVTNHRGEYVSAMLAWTVVTHSVQLADDFESSVGAMSHELGAAATALQERATSLHSAIEELSAAALEISKRVHDSLEVVRDAVETGQSATTMTEQLSESAGKISGVVTLIRAIAEKTNLLALNATIESARAGDAGKGFAVVASEVKTLANQSASAIGEINHQISEMQNVSRTTADAIVKISEIVKNVNIISTTIAGTVEEQQAATAEISRNISGGGFNPINNGGETLTIMSMATQLTNLSSNLQEQCSSFLQKIRTA